MKLERKYFNLAFNTIIALFMTFFMSFFMTVINVGFKKILLIAWLKSFIIGFPISLAVSIIFIPKIRSRLEKYVNKT